MERIYGLTLCVYIIIYESTNAELVYAHCELENEASLVEIGSTQRV